MNTLQMVKPYKITTSHLDLLGVTHVTPALKQIQHKLFFIHGFWSTGSMFDESMELLAESGYECIAADMLNHGQSAHLGDLGKTSMDSYISTTTHAIESLREKVVIVGHSAGALIGAKIAECSPGLVAGYIGLTSAPPRGVLMGPSAMVRMPKYFGDMLGKKAFSLTAPHIRNLICNGLSEDTFERFHHMMCLESGRAAFEVAYGKYAMHPLSCPSMVVSGRYDRITPYQDAVARRLGAGKPRELPLPHLLMSNPVMLVREIERWLRNTFKSHLN